MSNLNKMIGNGIKLVQKDKCFMETENGEDALVEGIISMWKITENGLLFKEKEVNFEYDMEFRETKEDEMKLQLSYDKKIVSLGVVDKK